MTDESPKSDVLSPWWRHGVIPILIAGFAVLLMLAIRIDSKS